MIHAVSIGGNAGCSFFKLLQSKNLTFLMLGTFPRRFCGGSYLSLRWLAHELSDFSYFRHYRPLLAEGWIVPLPAVPLKIQEGGAWTLQRLNKDKSNAFP